MEIDAPQLLAFLKPQIRDHGGKTEIDTGLWALFAVVAGDNEGNAIARSLLGAVPFAHHAGLSADDRWMLYYVDTASRSEAIPWLEALGRHAAGEIHPPTAAQRALIRDMAASATPHRIAQQLADLHARGEITAGLIREPAAVRALLDRLHRHEPLFFAAFLNLLTHHLLDLVVLLRQLIPEDVAAVNDLVKAGLSRDPFLRSRQAAEIRSTLLRYQMINPIDQQRNTAIANPYAVYLEIVGSGDTITAPINGTSVALSRQNFLKALRAIRRNLYRGESFGSLDTQAPWITAEIAYPFRFIKQRVDSRRELAPLDALYMLERAVEA